MAGRPRASITVVDKDFLPATEIFDITTILSSFAEFIYDRHRLEVNNVNCSICNMPPSLNKYGE